MATFEGKNYTKINGEPSVKVPEGQVTGQVKIIYDEIDFGANVYAIADVIKLGALLPEGARVIDATVKCPSLGTTGIFNVGWEASANGVEALDTDGLIVGADAGGQAVLAKCTASSAGVGKQFAAPVQLVAVFTEATDAASGLKLQLWVEYVMD